MYQRHFANVFDSKLRSADGVIFLGTWCLQIRVADVGSIDVDAVERCIGERDAYTLPGYNTSIGGSNWVGRLVPVEDPSSLLLVKSIFTSQMT
jgi:hypothetical protein